MTSTLAQRTAAAAMPAASGRRAGLPALGRAAFLVLYLLVTLGVARAGLNVQGVVLIAAVFGILALSLDLVAGMLGLYSLGVAGFFATGAYLTTLFATRLDMNVFLLLPGAIACTALLGILIGAASLRVDGLYFAITTFIFTLVTTVLATDLPITNGMQGLLGPEFPDFPPALEILGAPIAWAVMGALLVVILLMRNLRRSPFYLALLSIRDAEPSAQAAGLRTAAVKIGAFGVSGGLGGLAGWLFCFLGVISPSQFSWSVSLNVLVMVLLGGINTVAGPLLGAAFVSTFPVLVNINPWLQEIIYGLLSIVAIVYLPQGVVGIGRHALRARSGAPRAIATAAGGEMPEIVPSALRPATLAQLVAAPGDPAPETGAPAIACGNIRFRYPGGPPVLNGVDLEVRRGEIHGLIGPNGSGKSTLANIVAGRLQAVEGTVSVKGARVERGGPRMRARLGLRRTFQAANLVQELSVRDNVLLGAYGLATGLVRRAPLWPWLPAARRDLDGMRRHADEILHALGAGEWSGDLVRNVPHGIEQLTQLASVCVADPAIILLDEPATGLSAGEVERLAAILAGLRRSGVTMLIIEHQTRFLFPLCDRITVLNAGEVILTGTPDEVRADPVVRQVYLGE